MANTDRPSGFTFAKNLFGAPASGLIRKIRVASGADADIFVGSPLIAVDGEDGAEIGASDGDILGVAVGFGRDVPGTHNGGWIAGPYNPANLENRFFDASASTNTEWYIWYIPALDNLFEIQSASDLDLEIADTADFTAESGDTTTGRSTVELTTSSNADVNVVELVEAVDNDRTLTNARYLVMFRNPLLKWTDT